MTKQRDAGMGNCAAFSLVELLVVIAVIAIIAAIAIPNLANIGGSAARATRLQNAQLVVMTYNSYAEFHRASTSQAPPYGDLAAAVGAVISTNGLQVTNTRLGTTNFFRAPVATTNEIAMDRLDFQNGLLVYDAR